MRIHCLGVVIMIPQRCFRPARFLIVLSIFALILWLYRPFTKRRSTRLHSMNQHRGGDQVCKVQHIDPFNKQLMQLISSDGEHKCATNHPVQVQVAKGTVTISANQIISLRSRQMTDSGVGFSYMNYVQRFGDPPPAIELTEKQMGVIQNLESNACLLPQINNTGDIPDEIPVVFGSDCDNVQAMFNFTEEGLIVHKNTRKCFRPKSGPKSLQHTAEISQPKSDKEPEAKHDDLVLSDRCDSLFDVILGGVLRLSGSQYCLHPLWKTPSNGEKVWLYAECVSESRLSYHWYPGSQKKSSHVTNVVTFPLVTDMTHAQIQLSGVEDAVNVHVLSCVPKPLPSTKPSSSLKPNIVVLCIEELSAAHFQRELGSVSSMMDDMGWLQYEKHSAVSEINLLNLATVLHGISGMEEVPGVDTPIFKMAQQNNYISMVTADDPARVDAMKRGLNEALHSSLPFFHYLKEEYRAQNRDFCVNGQPIHKISFDYLNSFLHAYPDHAKLAFMIFSQLSRSSLHNLGRHGFLRKYLLDFLEQLKGMKNTIVIVHSLIGGMTPKIQDLPQTLQEVKRPFLATYTSQDITSEYHFEESRAGQLSTPFDIHVTLRHIMTSQGNHVYGRSLLKYIKPRKCREAAVYPPMCPCL